MHVCLKCSLSRVCQKTFTLRHCCTTFPYFHFLGNNSPRANVLDKIRPKFWKYGYVYYMYHINTIISTTRNKTMAYQSFPCTFLEWNCRQRLQRPFPDYVLQTLLFDQRCRTVNNRIIYICKSCSMIQFEKYCVLSHTKTLVINTFYNTSSRGLYLNGAK